VTGSLQLLNDLKVNVGALRLTVRRVRATRLDAFVPVKPQPAHRVEKLQVALFAVTGSIRVFDTKHQRAARVARIRPVKQGSTDQPNVGRTRR